MLRRVSEKSCTISRPRRNAKLWWIVDLMKLRAVTLKLYNLGWRNKTEEYLNSYRSRCNNYTNNIRKTK